MPFRVLAVDDDSELRRLYARLLGREGARVLLAADAEEALDVLRREPVDVVLLDWSLPGLSGADVLRAVRADARTRAAGVIVVTALGRPADAVKALEAGADDHVAKPFDAEVLTARIRSLARRVERGPEPAAALDGLALAPGGERALLDGRPLALSATELALLKTLLRRPDAVLPREYLWNAAWGYALAGWEHALEAAVSRLRRKLGPAWGPRLRSHRRWGYSLDRL